MSARYLLLAPPRPALLLSGHTDRFRALEQVIARGRVQHLPSVAGSISVLSG